MTDRVSELRQILSELPEESLDRILILLRKISADTKEKQEMEKNNE